MKPSSNATLVHRFTSREAAVTFKTWATRMLRVGETMQVYTEPEHPLPGLYVLGRKAAKMAAGKVDGIRTAAAAFGWAWATQQGKMARAKREAEEKAAQAALLEEAARRG